MTASKDTEENEMKILKLLAWLIAIPLGLCWKAVVLVDLWAWFIVPLGAPVIGMAHALGIALASWLFGSGLDNVKKNPETGGLERWALIQLVVLMVWGYGAVYHHFMQ